MTNKSLLALALAWGAVFPALAQAEPSWQDERVVGVFVCRSEFPLDELETLLTSLEQLQADLIGTLHIPRAHEPVELLLFRERASYEQYLAQHLPGVAGRRALFVKKGGLGRIYAYRSPELETDLRHECTHGLLHASLRNVPLWLDEGLAEYFETPRDQRVYDNPYLASLRSSSLAGHVPSLVRLEKKVQMEDTSSEDYRNAWGWTHFLLHGSVEGRKELLRYLGDLRSGDDRAGLLSERLREKVPERDSKLSVHLQTWQRPSMHTAHAVDSGQDVRR